MASIAGVSAVSQWFMEEFLEEETLDATEDMFPVLATLLRDDHAKVVNFWEDTIPSYLPNQLRKELRVPVSVFHQILDQTSDILQSNFVAGRQAICPEKKVAIFLQYIGSHNTIFDIGQKYGVTQYSVVKSRRQCSEAIINTLMKQSVQWPRDLAFESVNFNDKGPENFPGIVGAGDGCHIPICTPLVEPASYFNRKKFYSVNLQAIVDSNCSFTDVNIGQPGRRHDAFVLRNSSLWNSGYNLCGQGAHHIICDSAYPITRWLLTPYRNVGNLTRQQKAFNTALSRRRQVVERSFGMLKSRFRRLKLGIDIFDMCEINRLIMCGVILHNLCNRIGDNPDDLPDDDDINPNDPRLHPVPNVVRPINNVREGQLKRLTITNNL